MIFFQNTLKNFGKIGKLIIDVMKLKKWLTIFIVISILAVALFILFLVLFLRERKKNNTTIYSSNVKTVKNVQNYFELDQDYILSCFDPEYRFSNSKSFVMQFEIEPNGEGTIASCRINNKGWKFEIDSKRRLVFYSDLEKLESIEIEQMNQKTIYTLIYNGSSLSIKRNDTDIAKGEITQINGIGPLLLGMSLDCVSKCKPTTLLKGKIYDAKFFQNNIVLGTFSFDNRKIVFMDGKDRSFIKREATDFIFDL